MEDDMLQKKLRHREILGKGLKNDMITTIEGKTFWKRGLSLYGKSESGKVLMIEPLIRWWGVFEEKIVVYKRISEHGEKVIYIDWKEDIPRKIEVVVVERKPFYINRSGGKCWMPIIMDSLTPTEEELERLRGRVKKKDLKLRDEV